MAYEQEWRAGLSELLGAGTIDRTNEPLALEIQGETLVPLRLNAEGEWSEKRATWRDLTSRWVSVTSGLNVSQLSTLRSLFEHSAVAQRVRLSQLDEVGLDTLERCVLRGVTLFSDSSREFALRPVGLGMRTCLLIEESDAGSLTISVGFADDVSAAVAPDNVADSLEEEEDLGAKLPSRLQVLEGRFVLTPSLDAGVSESLNALTESEATWEIPAYEANEFWANYALQLSELGVLSREAQELIAQHRFGPAKLRGLLRFNPSNAQQVEIHWTVRRVSASSVVDLALDVQTTDQEVQQAMRQVAALVGWSESQIPLLFTKKFPIFELDRVRHFIETINISGRAEVDIDPALRDIKIFATGPEVELQIEDALSPEELTDFFREEETEHREASLRNFGPYYRLNLNLRLGEENLDTTDFLSALGRVERWWQTPEGNWVDLYDSKNQQLKRLIREFTDLGLNDFSQGSNFVVGMSNFGLVSALDSLAQTRKVSVDWEQAISALVNPPEVPAPRLTSGTWREYQEDGFRWMVARARAGLGGILADDMGLGKTMQMLAVIQWQMQQNPENHANRMPPVFVVVPASLVGTWVDQAARWFPGLKLYVQRSSVGKTAADLESVASEISQSDLVLTTYTLARMDIDFWEQQTFSGLVFDEAQFVKNPSTATHKALVRLRGKWAFALTGTPIENTATDLWSIMSLTVPTVLPKLAVFSRRFAAETLSDRSEALAELSDRVAPFLLRRTKDSVAKELPEKIEQIVSLDLEPVQRGLYAKYLVAARAEVADSQASQLNILTALTRLRQLALSARLLDHNAREDGAKASYLLQSLESLREDRAANQRNPHKILVFSQFVSFLGVLREKLDLAGIDYAYLDGTSRDRDRQVARFQGGEVDVFLISLKAGGFGLNLTEADYVFLADPWWNPAVEAQAVDRAHRLGQQRSVNVYRLVANDTIEQRVLELQEKKRDLIGAVLSGQENREAFAGISLDQLRSLLG